MKSSPWNKGRLVACKGVLAAVLLAAWCGGPLLLDKAPEADAQLGRITHTRGQSRVNEARAKRQQSQKTTTKVASHPATHATKPTPQKLPQLITPTPAPGGSSGSSTGGSSGPQLGANADLGGKRIFPADNPWNQDISTAPVDKNSDKLIAGIGLTKSLHPDFGTVYDGVPWGIPYVVVSGTQKKVPVSFYYADESDPGPYPVPANAPIEGGAKSTGDRHVLVLDRDHWMLYELFDAHPQKNGSWQAGSGAIFDLNSNTLRPAGWTSADAAGLPILPGLVRYDEVYTQKAINHALRFTVTHTRRAYVYPARHFASSNTDPNLPPMGMRVRLKAKTDISGFSPECQVILRALKKYGMIVADNGGDWFISGAPHPGWNDDAINELKRIKGSDFEVVQMGTITTK